MTPSGGCSKGGRSSPLPIACPLTRMNRILFLDGGWAVREGGTGDFISLLFGPRADLSNVILDPLPMMLRDSVAGLISISPDRFLARFLGVSDSGALPG